MSRCLDLPLRCTLTPVECLYCFPRSRGHSLRALFQEVLGGVDQPEGEVRQRRILAAPDSDSGETPPLFVRHILILNLDWLEDKTLTLRPVFLGIQWLQLHFLPHAAKGYAEWSHNPAGPKAPSWKMPLPRHWPALGCKGFGMISASGWIHNLYPDLIGLLYCAAPLKAWPWQSHPLLRQPAETTRKIVSRTE